jgi:hypothetical protein
VDTPSLDRTHQEEADNGREIKKAKLDKVKTTDQTDSDGDIIWFVQETGDTLEKEKVKRMIGDVLDNEDTSENKDDDGESIEEGDAECVSGDDIKNISEEETGFEDVSEYVLVDTYEEGMRNMENVGTVYVADEDYPVNESNVNMDYMMIKSNVREDMHEKPEERDNINPEGNYDDEKKVEKQWYEKSEKKNVMVDINTEGEYDSITYFNRQSSTKTEAVARYVEFPVLNHFVQLLTALSN